MKTRIYIKHDGLPFTDTNAGVLIRIAGAYYLIELR